MDPFAFVLWDKELVARVVFDLIGLFVGFLFDDFAWVPLVVRVVVDPDVFFLFVHVKGV